MWRFPEIRGTFLGGKDYRIFAPVLGHVLDGLLHEVEILQAWHPYLQGQLSFSAADVFALSSWVSDFLWPPRVQTPLRVSWQHMRVGFPNLENSARKERFRTFVTLLVTHVAYPIHKETLCTKYCTEQQTRVKQLSVQERPVLHGVMGPCKDYAAWMQNPSRVVHVEWRKARQECKAVCSRRS